MAKGFEANHPGVTVDLSTAGSQELRVQIEHGASADVFAAADLDQVEGLARAGHGGAPVVFARNRLVIALASHVTAEVRGVEDLPRLSRLAIGAPGVPIGRYTRQLLARAEARVGAGFQDRVLARVVTHGLNVRDVLTKVTLGEVDAGIVYRTDVPVGGRAEGGVRVVSLDPTLVDEAAYGMSVLTEATAPDLAREWVAYVLSPPGQAVLTGFGFSPAAKGTK